MKIAQKVKVALDIVLHWPVPWTYVATMLTLVVLFAVLPYFGSWYARRVHAEKHEARNFRRQCLGSLVGIAKAGTSYPGRIKPEGPA
jgi:hypothetical protein